VITIFQAITFIADMFFGFFIPRPHQFNSYESGISGKIPLVGGRETK
jgi:hypothetical protein